MKKRIKPAKPGMVIRDHQANLMPLPEKGKTVHMDTTWHRRLRDGDVVPATLSVKKPEPKKADDKPKGKDVKTETKPKD